MASSTADTPRHAGNAGGTRPLMAVRGDKAARTALRVAQGVGGLQQVEGHLDARLNLDDHAAARYASGDAHALDHARLERGPLQKRQAQGLGKLRAGAPLPQAERLGIAARKGPWRASRSNRARNAPSSS